MIVFPAVDSRDGKAVRLRRRDFDDVKVFSDDPVDLARYWQDQGAEALHVIDLDAARTGELVNVDLVERIVKTLDVPVQYGGGIRSATMRSSVLSSANAIPEAIVQAMACKAWGIWRGNIRRRVAHGGCRGQHSGVTAAYRTRPQPWQERPEHRDRTGNGERDQWRAGVPHDPMNPHWCSVGCPPWL